MRGIIMKNNSKKKQEQNITKEKILTKYDKKVLAKKKQEERERFHKKLFIGCAIAAIIGVVAGIAAYFIIQHNKAYSEYITVGDEKITTIEFDYYYNTTANNFISAYSSYLSYFGLDTSKSFDEQQYTQEQTWGDYFRDSAVKMLQQTKALVADAGANNFEYDVKEDYASLINDIKEAAAEADMSIKSYYKSQFGQHATSKNLKQVFEEVLLSSAYYDKLAKDNEPTSQEIEQEYNDNTDIYDSFDYRVLPISDKSQADEMLSKITSEESFAELCKTYAEEANKSNYESEDASLITKATSSSFNSLYKEWLIDSTRKEGDKTVISDEDNSTHYVLYFVERYYADGTDDTVSQSLINDRVTAYIDELVKNYEVTDTHNRIKGLE